MNKYKITMLISFILTHNYVFACDGQPTGEAKITMKKDFTICMEVKLEGLEMKSRCFKPENKEYIELITQYPNLKPDEVIIVKD